MRPAPFPGELAFVGAFVAGAGLPAIWFAVAIGHGVWLIAYAIGVSLLCYSLAILRRTQVAKRWPITLGRVVSSSIGEVHVPDENTNTQYVPSVLYEYVVGATLHQSNRFSVSSAGFRSVRWGDAKNLVFQCRPGAAVQVRVCPNNPNWSVLRSELSSCRRDHIVAVLIGGVLVTIVSLLVVVNYALSHPPSSGHATGGVAGRIIVLLTLDEER